MGVMLDPDGYLVVIDEERSQLVGINETVAFDPVPTGFYEISLSEVAENCEVAAPNLRPLTVSANVLSELTFNVTCVAAP